MPSHNTVAHADDNGRTRDPIGTASAEVVKLAAHRRGRLGDRRRHALGRLAQLREYPLHAAYRISDNLILVESSALLSAAGTANRIGRPFIAVLNLVSIRTCPGHTIWYKQSRGHISSINGVAVLISRSVREIIHVIICPTVMPTSRLKLHLVLITHTNRSALRRDPDLARLLRCG
jgi:hypothetical protein